MNKKTNITTTTTTASTDSRLSLAQCDTDGAQTHGAVEMELEQRLDALANTAATLGIDGLNFAVLRINAIDRDLRRIRLGKELQAKPPAGYCSVADAVIMLRISDRTLRRWIADGDLMPVRLGDRVFIELEKARKLKSIV